MITDKYLDSKFYCQLSGSQISIILYHPELQKDLGEIFTELESKANNHEEFNDD